MRRVRVRACLACPPLPPSPLSPCVRTFTSLHPRFRFRFCFRLRFRIHSLTDARTDYPRTLRTWDRRLKANLRQEVMAAQYPALREPATYRPFVRKWEYLFAYAGAGFAKGYITCHMLTFVRAVRVRSALASLPRSRSPRLCPLPPLL